MERMCFLLIAVLPLLLRDPGGGMTTDASVSLLSDLPSGDHAYDRQVVTFQCVIVGVDTVVNWISDDYIGTGGDVLQLASADPPGQTASNPRNPTTVATLVSTSRSGGVTTTVSELKLIASSQFPTSSVSCRDNGQGTINTTSFRVINPDVMLMHNLVGGNRAYDRQVVTFQCVITGIDTVLNWMSDDYIGTGGDMLQLASADPPGQTASNSRNPTSVATLVSTSRSGGVTTTMSELQLIASSQFPTSSVSCQDNGQGPPGNTTSFRVIDPDVTLTHNLVGNRAYDRQVVTFRCVITGVDTILNWISDHYIGAGGDVLQLASADPPGQTASNPRNPTTVATLVSTSRSGGVTMTVSELQLTASSQFPTSNVSCRDKGQGPVSTVIFQTLFELIATTSVMLDMTGDRSTDDGADSTFDVDELRDGLSPVLIGSIGAVVAIVILLFISVLVFLLTFMHRVKSRKRSVHADKVDSVHMKGNVNSETTSELTSSSCAPI